MDTQEMLTKAEQFLKAARVTFAAELTDACGIACYYAVFWAAIAMLHFIGVKRRRWKHGDLREVFGLECVKRRKLCPPEMGEWIGDLYYLRSEAAYETTTLPLKKAERILRRTEAFVQHAKEVCRQ